MDFTALISNMHAYQKQRGIIKKCVDNAQFAYDCMRFSDPTLDLKVSAVYMTSIDTETKEFTLWGGHLVVVVNGTEVIDPSYETFSAPDRGYFTSIADMLATYPHLKDQKQIIADAVKALIEFNEYAERINSGKVCATDKAYYNAQADALEAACG